MNEKFRFALLTNSCLTDLDIAGEISKADKKNEFNCVVHLGNIIKGDNPEKISDRVYADEVEKYRKSTKSKRLYVAQGRTDGYRNERFLGQLSYNMVNDEKWARKTEFLKEFGNVAKTENPYYYADFDEQKIRLVFLCPYVSKLDEENEIYTKLEGFEADQIAWLLNEALKVADDWKILVFSHSFPGSKFSGAEPFIYNNYYTVALLRAFQYAKGKLVGIISGDYGEGFVNDGGVLQLSINSAKDSEWYEVEVFDGFLTLNGKKYEFLR